VLYDIGRRDCQDIRSGCMSRAKYIWVKVIQGKLAKNIQTESC